MNFPSVDSPVAFALPASISPTVAGIVVGAVAGALGFIFVLFLATRRRPRRQVVTIPPYAPMTALARATPLPPPHPSDEPVVYRPSARFKGAQLQLSASSLARMGIPVGPFGERIPTPLSEDDLDEDDDAIDVDLRSAVDIAPVVVLAGGHRKAHESGPHPLSVIPSSSNAMRGTPASGVQAIAAIVPVAPILPPPPAVPAPSVNPAASSGPMRAARIDDLAYDDAPTEIAETLFDEPPRPRMRSEPPKIRPIQPAPPRFAGNERDERRS